MAATRLDEESSYKKRLEHNFIWFALGLLVADGSGHSHSGGAHHHARVGVRLCKL